jgi:hypothetical protein
MRLLLASSQVKEIYYYWVGSDCISMVLPLLQTDL